MALADFDLQPAAQSANPYPPGYNTGAFNADGTLQWAALIHQPPVAAQPDGQGRFPWTTGYGTGPVAAPGAGAAAGPSGPGYNPNPAPINLRTLFSAQQPTPMFASQRSPAVQQAVNGAFATQAATQGNAQQSLTDFTKQFIESRPKVDQYGQEEQDSISQIYGSGPGSVQTQLADLNRQRQAATNQAAAAAMSRAGRANSVRRLTGGNSSYLDRLYAQDLSGIATGAAGQYADQGRADLQYLTGQRAGNVGRRQQIIDSILNRNMGPADAAAHIQNQNVDAIGALANLEYGNHNYTAPEDAYSKRLEFMQRLREMGYGDTQIPGVTPGYGGSYYA